MKNRFLSILFLIFSFIACKNIDLNEEFYNYVENPDFIAEKAFQFAVLYKDSDTEYEFGGQDPLRAIKIDCSGLVVMCYKYALVDTCYSLLFDDATANDMYKKYSVQTDKPRQGDLLFMGGADSNNVTHIAIFDKEDNGQIYFIDSTKKDTIDGVTKRNYQTNDKRIKSFGIMKLKNTK